VAERQGAIFATHAAALGRSDSSSATLCRGVRRQGPRQTRRIPMKLVARCMCRRATGHFATRERIGAHRHDQAEENRLQGERGEAPGSRLQAPGRERAEREQRENREQGTGNREQGTGNREQGTGNRERRTGCAVACSARPPGAWLACAEPHSPWSLEPGAWSLTLPGAWSLTTGPRPAQSPRTRGGSAAPA